MTINDTIRQACSPERTYDVLVIGTGAAGYNAACRVAGNRRTPDGKPVSVAVITEGVHDGTSRNTGSDKQTYYKLGLSGDSPDSVRRMAGNLFAGGAVDGDNALCEAALSVRCFLNLCELGVEFPVNRYGEYIGYKTDHDPFERATSAGPLTSRFMTEALEKQASERKIPVYDRLLAVEILTCTEKDGAKRVCGLLCLNRDSGALVVFRTNQVILATGGPAGIYADSVYPLSQTGSTGLALDAGASLQNMTEWQYGLASVSPRWNVSGTYMQVLPRFLSVDRDGHEREFLADDFADPYEALSAVFLKGYQWPFDSRKVLTGSSVIDLLVYRECVLKGRRVYLDYTENPFHLDSLDYSRLHGEAFAYLSRAGACFGRPIDRLLKMNAPAVDLYREKGVDLTTERLEIALSAQHNNGGIAVDSWWQTSVHGLFAVGECAGTHGVSRPGGSALNAGQVGSLRAAQYIGSHLHRTDDGMPPEEGFLRVAEDAVSRHQAFCQSLSDNRSRGVPSVTERLSQAMRRMSDCGGAIRDRDRMKQALAAVKDEYARLADDNTVSGAEELFTAYKLKDALTVQTAVLSAMLDFSETVGKSRGSALYGDRCGELREGLDEVFRFRPGNGEADGLVQEIRLVNGEAEVLWRPVRPIPAENDVFETVWRRYREDGNIY